MAPKHSAARAPGQLSLHNFFGKPQQARENSKRKIVSEEGTDLGVKRVKLAELVAAKSQKECRQGMIAAGEQDAIVKDKLEKAFIEDDKENLPTKSYTENGCVECSVVLYRGTCSHDTYPCHQCIRHAKTSGKPVACTPLPDKGKDWRESLERLGASLKK